MRPPLHLAVFALGLGLATTACAQPKPAPLPPDGSAGVPPKPAPQGRVGPPSGPAPQARPQPDDSGPQVATGPGAKPPPLPAGRDPAFDGNRQRARSSGTGFVVAQGRVLTNNHVIEGCGSIILRTTGGTEMPATVTARDPERDLAVLTVQGNPGPALPFRSGPDMRRGEAVVTYGFPLAGLLSSGPTLTTGEISALSGLRDNQRHFQISAPVQPGNSGGPLLDLNGNVVGVITSKLNAQRIAQSTGDIPQNVNFAVKGTEAVDFLQRNGVRLTLVPSGGPIRAAPEVGEVAHPSTVFLRCMAQ